MSDEQAQDASEESEPSDPREPANSERPSSGRSSAFRIIAVTMFGVVLVTGIAVALAMSGSVDKVERAKRREPYDLTGVMARTIVAKFEREEIGDREGKRGYTAEERLCPSWPHPVPRTFPRGRQEAPSADDYDDPAIQCTGYRIVGPVYYQYNYTRTADGFIITARGDLDGDGIESEYEYRSEIHHQSLVRPEQLRETNPGE